MSGLLCSLLPGTVPGDEYGLKEVFRSFHDCKESFDDMEHFIRDLQQLPARSLSIISKYIQDLFSGELSFDVKKLEQRISVAKQHLTVTRTAFDKVFALMRDPNVDVTLSNEMRDIVRRYWMFSDGETVRSFERVPTFLEPLFSSGDAVRENCSRLDENIVYRFWLKRFLLSRDNKLSFKELVQALGNLKRACIEQCPLAELMKLTVHEFSMEILGPMMEYFHQHRPLDVLSHSEYAHCLAKNVNEYMPATKETQKGDLYKLVEYFKKLLLLDLIKVLKPAFHKLEQFPHLLDDCCFLDRSILADKTVLDILKFKTDDSWNEVSMETLIHSPWPSFSLSNDYSFYSFWFSVALLVKFESTGDERAGKPFTLLNNIVVQKDGASEQLRRLYQDSFMLAEEKEAVGALLSFLGLFEFLARELKNRGKFTNITNMANRYLDYHPGLPQALLSSVYQYACRSDVIMKFLNSQVDTVVPEYGTVLDVHNGRLSFRVSRLNRVQLVDSGGNIEMDSTELSIVASKLGIAVVPSTVSTSASEQVIYAQKFVERYQQCEVLRNELDMIWFHEDGDKVYCFSGQGDGDDVREIIMNLRNEREKILDVINKHRHGTLGQFSLEHLCLAFQKFQAACRSTADVQSELRNELLELFAGSVILPCRETFKADLHRNIENSVSFEQLLQDVANILERSCGNAAIPIGGESIKVYKGSNESMNKRMRESVLASVVRPIIVESLAQEIGMMFWLLFSVLENSPVPQTNQILACSPDVTCEGVQGFFQFYKETNMSSINSNPRLFLLLNPVNLAPDVARVLEACLSSIRGQALGGARLVLLQAIGLDAPRKFVSLVAHFNLLNYCEAKIDWSTLGVTYFKESEKRTLHYIPAYFVHTRQPRTGKSYVILREIADIKDNFYWRVTVDSSTTLSSLIAKLRQAQIALSLEKNQQTVRTICYHFNVDGDIDEMLTFYILSLVLFKVLNDGVTMPFVVTSDMRFYFEFGGGMLETNEFLDKCFPIGRHMEQIEIPEASKLFSFDDCLVEEHKVIRQENARRYLAEAAALVTMEKLYQGNRMAAVSVEESMCTLADQESTFIQNPKRTYEILSNLVTSLIGEVPLLGQLSDVAKVVCRFKGPVFSEQSYLQEMEEGAANPYRYMALLLLLQTAVFNSGISYTGISKSKSSKLEPDEQRLNYVKEKQQSIKELLLVMDPANEFDNSYHTLPHAPGSITASFHLSLQPDYQEMFASRGEWERRAQNPVEMLEILSKLLVFTKDPQLRRNYQASWMVLKYGSLDGKGRETLNTHLNTPDVLDKIARKDFSLRANPEFCSDQCLRNFVNVCHDLLCSVPELKGCGNLGELLDAVQQYALRHSMMLSYSLSVHSIERLVHLLYRVYSNVPVVLMGETGSGKTYTIRFLKEIIGSETKLEIKVFDGGTTEKEISTYVRAKMANMGSSNLLFFFDEVNTAPCQWFIKELIIDRCLDGTQLPDSVKFVCAVNPYRKMPEHVEKRLRGLPPRSDGQKQIENLVYTVRRMPESFMAYLLPADPPNDLQGRPLDNISVLTEHERGIKQVVALRLKEAAPKITEIVDFAVHFSSSQEFSPPVTAEVFRQQQGCDPWDSLDSFVDLISSLAIYAQRLLTAATGGFYEDPGFVSLREPERFAHLIRWFAKLGNKKQGKPLNMAIQLAFAITYMLGLTDFSLSDSESPRDVFMKKVCEFWRKLNQSYGTNCPEWRKAPDFREWKENIANETKRYADMFVDDDEGISKNSALCENIWASYVCITNNIPLWIIGLPGTSKSLAVNIVMSKLFSLRGKDVELKQLPRLIYQTYMCSEDSRPEALMNELHNVAAKSMMIPEASKMSVLLLEEIGQADISPYLPLKCLHSVIDQGYMRPGMDHPVLITLIGLSNYIMDSAKLNRGILIIRDELSKDAKKETARNIFESTSRAVRAAFKSDMSDAMLDEFLARHRDMIDRVAHTYHDFASHPDNRKLVPYLGLRDFYGLIRNIANILMRYGQEDVDRLRKVVARNFTGTFDRPLELYQKLLAIFDVPADIQRPDPLELIRDNLQEKWGVLKSPLMRHLIIVNTGDEAVSILTEQMDLVDPLIIYGNNFTGMADSEWISTDLQIFAHTMRVGGTVIFVGAHKCFENLYDVFNLRYESIGGKNFALISYAGDSYPVMVHQDFRAIIVVDKEEYRRLPRPFLSRFEKIRLDYELLARQCRLNIEYVLSDILEAANGPNNLFPSWHQSHWDAAAYCAQKLKLTPDETIELALMNAQPSKFVQAALRVMRQCPNEARKGQILDYLKLFLGDGLLHSSIPHLLYGYTHADKDDNKSPQNSLSNKLYHHWQNSDHPIKGIQAVVLVPFVCDFQTELVTDDDTTTVVLQFEDRPTYRDVYKAISVDTHTLVLLVVVKSVSEQMRRRIGQLQAVLAKVRAAPPSGFKARLFHCMIVVNMSACTQGTSLSFVPGIDWPPICVDTPVESPLKPPLSMGLKTIDLPSLLFLPATQWIETGETVSNEVLFQDIRHRLGEQAGAIFSSCESMNEIRTALLDLMSQSVFSQQSQIEQSWVADVLMRCSSTVPSLLEYLGTAFLNMMANAVASILRQYTQMPLDRDATWKVSENLCHIQQVSCYAQQFSPEPIFVPLEARYEDADDPPSVQFYKYVLDLASDFRLSVDEIDGKVQTILDHDKYQLDEAPNDFWAAHVLRLCPLLEVRKDFTQFLDIVQTLYCRYFDTDELSVCSVAHNVAQRGWLSIMECVCPLYSFVSLPSEEEEEEEDGGEEDGNEEEEEQDVTTAVFGPVFSATVEKIFTHKWESLQSAKVFFEDEFVYLATWYSRLECCNCTTKYHTLEALKMLFESTPSTSTSPWSVDIELSNTETMESILRSAIEALDDSLDEETREKRIHRCLEFWTTEVVTLQAQLCDYA